MRACVRSQFFALLFIIGPIRYEWIPYDLFTFIAPQSRTLEEAGYPAPDLPYLAWVPADGGSGEKWMKCLLCQQWCQDETSHTGTQRAPAGSKDHQKKLRNYGPGDPWYEEEVESLELRA